MNLRTIFQSQYVFVVLAAACLSSAANASCGAASCALNTNWDLQGVHPVTGQWRVDFHSEFIEQDQLRIANHRVSATQMEDEEVLELSTRNRNFTAMLDYTFNQHWGVSASLPRLDRDHRHLAEPQGVAELQQWEFDAWGDARIVTRYVFDSEPGAGIWALQFGIKLDTGKIDQKNSAGLTAERSLQAGTGSRDAIVGVLYSHQKPNQNLSYFAQLQVQPALSSQDNFRPGNLVQFNLGIGYPLTKKLRLMTQINNQVKQRDSGINAEPEVSGGSYTYLSPGLAYALLPRAQIYGFWQQPLYREMNGAQLVANHNVAVGVSVRF